MGKPIIKCDGCSKVFKYMSYYTKHRKKIHGIPEEEATTSHTCYYCNKTFTRKENLHYHIQGVHCVGKEEGSLKKCELCDFKTVYAKNLKRHFLHMHYGKNSRSTKRKKSKPPSIVPENSQKFECSLCDASFLRKSSLSCHVKKVHYRTGEHTVMNKRCPLCNFTASGFGKKLMYEHFEKSHGISIEHKDLTFKSLEKFFEWKRNFENQTVSKFIKQTSSPTILFFKCHRSGNFKSAGKGKRRLKVMGSCKINSFCPAFIKAKLMDSGDLEVTYQDTHVGHKNEFEHVRLTDEERKNIAMQLAANVPHHEILKRIRHSLKDDQLKRIHLIDKKDIINIEKSLNFNSNIVKAPDNNVEPDYKDESFQNLKKSPNTALLLYKPQGCLDRNFSVLEKDDFLCIFMTNDQKNILLSHGLGIIGIDSFHKSRSHGFQLFTLMTVDDTLQGFPVAFMFTNRDDEVVIDVFFSKIKEVVGLITPIVFLSNMDQKFSVSWETIMGSVDLILYWSRDVLQSWKEDVCDKIKIKDKRRHSLKILQDLLYEVDKGTFHGKLEESVKAWENDIHTKSFCDYFFATYVDNGNFQKWAFCYHIDTGINTDLLIKSFSKVLLYFHSRDEQVKRLPFYDEKVLYQIVSLIQDELFKLITKRNRGRVEQKIKILRSRHDESFAIKEDIVQNDGDVWRIQSSLNQEFCLVKKIRKCDKCMLKCFRCKSCFHEYKCSCDDYSVKNNMCKHIHYVCRIQNESDAADNTKNSDLIVGDPPAFIILDETGNEIRTEIIIINEVNVDEHRSDEIFQLKKRKFIEDHVKMLEDCIKTEDDLEFVKNQCQSIVCPSNSDFDNIVLTKYDINVDDKIFL